MARTDTTRLASILLKIVLFCDVFFVSSQPTTSVEDPQLGCADGDPRAACNTDDNIFVKIRELDNAVRTMVATDYRRIDILEEKLERVMLTLHMNVTVGDCRYIRLTSERYETRRLQWNRLGVFEQMMDVTCDERPVYQHTSGKEFLYHTAAGYWLVGPYKCTDSGGLHSKDKAQDPGAILNPWMYHDVDGWKADNTITSKCRSHLLDCDRIEITTTNTTVQVMHVHILGFYTKMIKEECNNRPVYQSQNGRFYLYSMIGNLEPGIFWMVGATKCSNAGWLQVYDGALRPEDIMAIWTFHDGDAWSRDGTMNVKCGGGI